MALATLAVLVSAAACSGSIDSHNGNNPSNAGASGANPNAGSGNGLPVGGGNNNAGGSGSGNTNAGGSSNPGGGSGSGTSFGGSAPLPSGVDPSALIPERIRRLANAEFDASVKNLSGMDVKPADKFAPDARQSGFTLNDAQRVDNVTAKQIYAAASELSAAFDVTGKAPCADMSKAEACAMSFIASYGAKAYRRPLSAEESAGLLTVYKTGAEGATYADGIRLVVRALINSAGFLYLTEIGEGGAPPASGTSVALTPYELASSLSFLITNAPPSDQLLADAVAGKLATPEGREKAFWDLIGTAGARDRVVRVVREWLGVDRISETDKDTNVYRTFPELKAAMTTESVNFVEAVIKSTGNVSELLGADWTVVSDPKLAQLYGATGMDRITLPTRRGILNQAAFLSVFAHAHESSPVLRGVDVARRLACLTIPSPTTLNIVVVPPPPDPNKTTRERFDIHSTDNECVGCHKNIDEFGFAFEQFDGMGAFRTMDANKPVNSKATIASGTDFDGEYADSNALAVAMSKSPQVAACFARHMFRGSAGRSDDSMLPSEDAYLKYWKSLPTDKQGNILETLLTFVKSPLFTHRRAL
ncbi:MAG: DUF1592 domain-containing protein [Myxococcota bacterium]